MHDHGRVKHVVFRVLAPAAVGIALLTSACNQITGAGPLFSTVAEATRVAVTSSVEIAVATPTVNPTGDDAEYMIFYYYAALGYKQFATALEYLAPEVRSRTTEADLEASVAGTEAVGLAAIVPQSLTGTRAVYQALVSARTIPGVESEWNLAANTRYVECVRTPEGWRINRISPEPFPPA
jgi:hypothetical protein